MIEVKDAARSTDYNYTWMSPQRIWEDNDSTIESIKHHLKLSRKLHRPQLMPERLEELEVTPNKLANSFLNRLATRLVSETDLDQLTPKGLIRMLQATHNDTKEHAKAHATIAKNVRDNLSQKLHDIYRAEQGNGLWNLFRKQSQTSA